MRQNELAIIAGIFSIGLVAWAQDNAEIVSKVEAVKYPPLGRQPRIQGDVRLHVGAKGVEVISGHPLLVPGATKSLTELGRLSETEVDVVYHCSLVEPTLRINTEKTVREPECVDGCTKKQNRSNEESRGDLDLRLECVPANAG